MRVRRGRGSTYLLVLAVSSVLMILGLAAASVARVDNLNVAANSDWTEAQLLAMSAAENALCRIADNEDWRDELSSPVSVAMGRGTMRWQITDPGDGDLSDNASDPILIVASGQVGDSNYMLGLSCIFVGEPMEAITRCLCCGGNIDMELNSKLTVTGAPVSANGDFDADRPGKHGAVLDGDLEADKVKWKQNVTGTVTKHTPAFAMPDSGVVDTYIQRAVTISGQTLINRQALGPGHNPWGAASADGVYYIDAADSYVTIRDSRILGTLVVRCRKLTIEGNVLMESNRSDMPVLIVDGDLELDYTSNSLSESEEDTNFNLAGVPYEGVSDSDKSDSYPGEIHGFIHVRGDLELKNTAIVRGGIVCEGSAICEGQNQIIHEDRLTDEPVIGYTTGEGTLRCDGWRRITD